MILSSNVVLQINEIKKLNISVRGEEYNQPFQILREATREEYLVFLQEYLGEDYYASSPAQTPYYYEVSTD